MREIEVRTLAQFSVAPPSAANIAVAQQIELLPKDTRAPRKAPARYVPAEQIGALFGATGGGT